MTAISSLKVFATHPHRCSYLEDQEATTLFVDPHAEVDAALYTRLSEMGFRRSGSHLYRPHCQRCNACVPCRIPVADFRPNRQQRKVLNRNRDLTAHEERIDQSEEHYQLYARYIQQRHGDGDMYPPSKSQYHSFLTREWGVTECWSFRLQGRLLAVAVVDRLNNGLSAIYTFFEPEQNRRSLGAYAVLWQIERARELALDYVYLGYWIKNCQKMTYKINYRPLQLYLNTRWVTLSR